MILAKQLKRLLRRRYAFVNEVIDSRLPRRHVVLIIRAVEDFDAPPQRCGGSVTCLYDAAKYEINQRGPHGIQA